MEKPEGYFSDLFQLFSGKERERKLYHQAFAKMEQAFPQARVKGGKSQVSFYGKHLFAAFPRRCGGKRIGRSTFFW